MYQPSLFTDQATRFLPPRSLWKLARRGIFLGTSGFSYDDWTGPFYPAGTRKNQMLEYYQHFFPAVELNYTYYTIPRPSTLFQLRNTAPDLRFTVKAHQSITHERRGSRQEWQDFADALSVLSDTGQLAAVLFQFPYSFKCTHDNYLYLEDICEYFNPLRMVLEFRHAGWEHDTVREYARKRGVAICSVDAPRLPGLCSSALCHSRPVAYYRLHGRNAKNWFDGDNVTRYDYTYSREEIAEIARNIVELATVADTVYVFGNNHPRAQAIETVISLAEALDHSPALDALQPRAGEEG